MLSERETFPTIVVDRAIGAYLSSLNVDLPTVQDYYESLVVDSKPSLGDCVVYFSELGVVLNDHTLGMALHNPEPLPGYKDPLAPAANITIFVGSHLSRMEHKQLSTNELNDLLCTSLAHELAHYASFQTETITPPTEEEQLVAAELLLTSSRANRYRNVAGIAVKSSLTEFGVFMIAGETISPALALLNGVAAQVVSNAISRKRRTGKRERLTKRAYELYAAREHEVHAREDAEGVGSLISVTPKPSNNRPRPDLIYEDDPLFSKAVHFVHKRRSLGLAPSDS